MEKVFPFPITVRNTYPKASWQLPAKCFVATTANWHTPELERCVACMRCTFRPGQTISERQKAGNAPWHQPPPPYTPPTPYPYRFLSVLMTLQSLVYCIKSSMDAALCIRNCHNCAMSGPDFATVVCAAKWSSVLVVPCAVSRTRLLVGVHFHFSTSTPLVLKIYDWG